MNVIVDITTEIASKYVEKSNTSFFYEIMRSVSNYISSMENPETTDANQLVYSHDETSSGDYSFRFSLIMHQGETPFVTAEISGEEWSINYEGITLKNIPEANKLLLFKDVGKSLDEANVLKDDPWAGMIYTNAREEDGRITLTIPELSITEGWLTSEGIAKWM